MDGLYDATYIFSPGQDDQDNIHEDVSKRMLYPRAGHCFVKTKSEMGHDVYLVIGGEKLDEDPRDILYVHCTQEDCLDFEWFGGDIEGLDDGVSLEVVTCTTFTDHMGDQAVMIVTNEATLVIGQTCGTGEVRCTLRSCKMPCTWTVKNSTQFGVAHSKVTTLDNTPFLFIENVIYFFDSENNKWLVRQDSMMEYRRLHHTVVSVPEDWLCYDQFTVNMTL